MLPFFMLINSPFNNFSQSGLHFDFITKVLGFMKRITCIYMFVVPRSLNKRALASDLLYALCRMNYSNVLRVKFQFEKINFFWLKMTNFFLSAQNASICIMMHQNVCRMNCANVLCMKLSKKWF